MPNIYDINFELQAKNLEVPTRRLPKFLAFMGSLMRPNQWLRDLFFIDYVGGVKYTAYSNVTTYTYGDRITYVNRSNYEYIAATGSGNLPTDTTYWIKVQDVYLGLTERSKYSSMKIILERVLNTYFNITPVTAPLIYIQTNLTLANSFIVFPFNTATTAYVYKGFNNQTSFVFNFSYTSSPFCFTIKVPLALANALTTEAPDTVPNISASRASIIQNLVDKYNTASVGYNIETIP